MVRLSYALCLPFVWETILAKNQFNQRTEKMQK